MKTIKLIFLFSIFSVGVFAQRNTAAKECLYVLNDKIMIIEKADGIHAISIYVPAGATDSCYINGDILVVDGIATDSITIPPNMPLNLSTSNSSVSINYLRINGRAGSKTIVILTPKY